MAAEFREISYGVPVWRDEPQPFRCPWDADPCESCGQRVTLMTWNDERQVWADLLCHRHDGSYCERSRWAEHTPARCREFRDGREWVSLGDGQVKTRRDSPIGEWAWGTHLVHPWAVAR